MVAPHPLSAHGVPPPPDVGGVDSLGTPVAPLPPGEMLPSGLGDVLESSLGTREVNGERAAWPCGEELPGPPSDCGASRVLLSPPGWMTLSFGTGSGSKATPARPPRAPT